MPLAVLVSTVVLAVCAERSEAQRPPFTTFQLRQAVLEDGNFGPSQQKMLNEYFESFFFKLFEKPVRSDDLPNLRKQYKIIVRDVPKTKGHDALNALVLGRLRKFLGGNHDTTIKYNAMLLLGELNESDEGRNMKPLPGALALLVYVLAVKDRPELDYLKPAALVGLARFAEEGGIGKDKAAEVTGHLLALVNEKDAPPGRRASVHNYMRRSAAQVLALMGGPGADNSVVKAFEAMLSDPQASVPTRCETARYLGMLKFPPEAKVDVQSLANLLGHQTAEICDAEIARSEEKGQDKGASRRFFMYVLDSSDAGLQGLYESAERGSDSQKFVYSLREKMSSLLRTLSDLEETKEADVATIVRPEIDKIKELLTAKVAATGPLVAADPSQVPAKPDEKN